MEGNRNRFPRRPALMRPFEDRHPFRRNDDRQQRTPFAANRSNAAVNRAEGRKPIGYKTLQSVLTIDGEIEFILKISSEMNGFPQLLDQEQIGPDLMCLILAALAKASDCSTEVGTVQILVHFYMKIIPKLNANANFHRELIMYSVNLRNHLSIHSEVHITAIQNLLTFLRRLQLTLYQKSFDVVQDIVHQFALQIEFLNRKGNVLNDRIIELLKQLNDSVMESDRMKAETARQEVLLEPPDNFRDIPIYPSVEDILYNHEPFIRKNVVDGNYVGGIDHYLDTQFRLLREDFVRPLRNGICMYSNIQFKNRDEALKRANYRVKDLNVYPNVHIISSKFEHNQQVHLCTFDYTPFQHLQWQYNKRMLTGSLMCFSPDDFKTFFFATITGLRDPEKLARGKFQIKLEIESKFIPEITPFITYVMVESQVYFEAYRHNLKVLQEFSQDNFPLERYIVDVNKEILPPSYVSDDTVFNIPNGLTDEDAKICPVQILNNREWPPHSDFNMDESQFEAFRAALTKQMVIIQGPPGTGKTYIGLRIVETLLANISDFPILIVCYTNHALDQFLEGIQMFCGTAELIRIGGKSQSEALQKLNLSNIKKEVVINHNEEKYIRNSRFESNNALKNYQERISSLELEVETVKEHFIGHGLEKIISSTNAVHLRQFRSHTNERFDTIILDWLGYKVETDKNADTNYHQPHSNTSGHGQQSKEPAFEEPLFDAEEINEIERSRQIVVDWDSENKASSRSLPNQHNQYKLSNIVPIKFEDLSSEGFRTATNKRNFRNKFKHEIAKTHTMPREKAAAINDIHSISLNERWDLYRLWIKLYVEGLEKELRTKRDLFENEFLRYNAVRNQEDVVAVRKAKIIGMTTTGAAKYRHIIAGVKPKIIIVEEAAEVLEAHIVTALCKETDHLILIGDHMQLRPNPAVYELATKFGLEISLFERLIKNKTEFYQLKQQHRMRPCISSLLVPHIYKQLLDHPSVEQYEDVKGIKHNMFFINHEQNESCQQETCSRTNPHEASFIVELCRYIILQGYDASQVTILTTYSGQLHLIRQFMLNQNLLTGVRAAVVDNYQGDENDIILLSFVRSNEEANIGFLKTSNRVNVALSRARKGLYCIGNFDCLAEKSQLWKDLVHNLAAQNAIGSELEIYCQKHTDYKTNVASKNDFAQVPEGGCNRPCGSRLPCGHVCPSVCHIVDAEHNGVFKKCCKNCDKMVCENEHRCPKSCHFDEECGPCTVFVEKVRTECKHSVKVMCSSDPSESFCQSRCERKRSCGHNCTGDCGKICDETVCEVLIEAKSPCGHTVKIECSNADNKMKLFDACTEACNVELKCGHLCKGSCGKCKYGRLHISCPEKCTRILVCGHPCTGLCSVDCKPCNKKCSNRCVHSKCRRRCGEPCPPCKEKCEWKCAHLKCTKLCSEPCDRELCKHPNKKIIRKCRHPSIGVCGERIPRLCRICNKDEVEEIFLGHEDEEGARFIELDDCGHVIEVKGLINWLKTGSDSTESNRHSIQLKKCPKCKTEIRHTKALNTFIQASLHDVGQVKLKVYGDRKENVSLQRTLQEKCVQIFKEGLFKNNVVFLRGICGDIKLKTLNKNNEPLPKQVLIELKNKFKLVERLQLICVYFCKRNKKRDNVFGETITKMKDRIQMAADFVANFQNCDQQRHDIETEIEFLQMMVKVIVEASAIHLNDAAKILLMDAFELAHKPGSATESVQNEFKKLVIEAFKKATVLGISIEETKMVLAAMGFGKGHWYKCPNGHVYAIGDCGGAMEQSVCNECGSEIGGTNHRLLASNALASDIDGATGPAWPTNLQQ